MFQKKGGGGYQEKRKGGGAHTPFRTMRCQDYIVHISKFNIDFKNSIEEIRRINYKILANAVGNDPLFKLQHR